MAHKSKLFTLNTPLFKDLTLIFHWKELTPLVQIPHPSQARFKFPTPSTSMTIKALGLHREGGGGGKFKSFELLAHYSMSQWLRLATLNQEDKIYCIP